MKSLIGIDFGSKKIKIVKYNKKINGKFEFNDYKIIDTPTGIMESNDFCTTSELEFALSDTFNDLKAKNAEVYYTLHQSDIIVRVRELPCVPLKDMKDLVLIEAEQFLPYDIETFIIDYKVLSEIERENERYFRTMIVAIPKIIANDIITLSNKLKLDVKTMNVYTDAINNFSQKFLTSETENIMVVDIGFSSMEMIVFEGNEYFAGIKSQYGWNKIEIEIEQLSGLDNIKIEDILLTKETVKSSNIDIKPKEVINEPKEFENIKLNKLKERLDEIKNKHKSSLQVENKLNLNKTSESLNYDLITKTSFSEIEVEISRMIDYFQSRQYGAKIHKIFIMGGASNINGLLTYLSDSIDAEISYIDSEVISDKLNNNDFNLLIPALSGIIGG